MTVTTASCRDLFEGIKRQIVEKLEVICEQYYVQYCTLLGHYVTAIRDNVITRDRNQLMFDIASFEIGKFMETQRSRPEKQKEFQILVDIIHKSIGDKLNFL
ncbi:hypothetical protein GCK72_015771 [Caenorhabditis remanei]|uniref:Uncharacterized protein n=1 Tax=Caenorhabditis remanei TaxID=31234 RepID=A0A6A5GXE3_CAERE|nr:hypothetical protein GCK72_015771 [Caenorhabditis remanei]KAF1759306.1 hypothetical protein GCK72_015771 [Caenorhabditis remanei]